MTVNITLIPDNSKTNNGLIFRECEYPSEFNLNVGFDVSDVL
jgi:hypothetical protein